ncbi:MAG: hypothetical protein JST00_09630 [Deltaproteobacteria bacterium]|nr:hypothetical protein [Deltaproteobacteria bacterium]
MSFLRTLQHLAGGISDPRALSASAIELPTWVTPTIAGLTVGAVVGVVGFVTVLLFVGRERPRRRTAAMPARPAENVVHIPPYSTLPRDTPVPPPWMGQPVADPFASAPGYRPNAFSIPTLAPEPVAAAAATRGAPPLRPSTELSARVFAKMGYAVEVPPEMRSPSSYVDTSSDDAGYDAPNADPDLELDESELGPEEELAVHEPVGVAPVMIVGAPPPQETLVLASSPLRPSAAVPPQPPAQITRPTRSTPPAGTAAADKSAPHPLGVISSSSSAMRMKAASVADLDLDDDDAKTKVKEPSAPPPEVRRGASISDLDLEDNGATQICETIFDEPPQPRRRTDPPKIRPKAPAPPRFPSAKVEAAPAAAPARPRLGSGASLPRVTTPAPGRVRQA